MNEALRNSSATMQHAFKDDRLPPVSQALMQGWRAAGNHDLATPEFVKIMPAYAGFYVLEAMSDDSGRPSEACKYPVVAWALEKESLAAYPITLEGVQKSCVYILQPDGSVERPCVAGFANIGEWLACLQGEYDAGKAGKS